jgi:protein O-GlcNAc transferase
MLERLLDRLKRRAAALAARTGAAPAAPGSGVAAAERAIAAGNRAEEEGRITEACLRYREAVDAAPAYAKAHLNLGIGLEAAGDAEGALGAYRAAFDLDAEDPYVNYNLGKMLYMRREAVEAARHLRAALERKPDFPEARIALSNVYDVQGQLAAAAGELEIALRQRPGDPGALYNYGVVLQKQRRFDEAEAALRHALDANPGFMPAYRALGGVLLRQGRLAEALEVYGEGRRLSPDSADLESVELFLLTGYEAISAEELFARHRAFGERLEKRVPARFEPFHNDRDPERRLRIGYVSGDFCFHPVSLFLVPVFDKRDRSNYEVYCYSTGDIRDDLTRQAPGWVEVWRDVASLSDGELADVINADGIDILVDLSGHSGRSRLDVFAQQPAPVQATWLGYLNTTGTIRIHYRITDGNSDPPGLTEQLHTERLVRLPDSQWCYRPFITIDGVDAPPAARNGFVTFGSFNDVPKISASTLELWARLLAQLPSSRLVVVGAAGGHTETQITRKLESAGIDAQRLELLPRLALDEYYRCFNRVDIALDTTPYSGGTTTLDALWMGVPVVTVPGARSASRSAGSILATVGLDEWIGRTPDDYVRIAVEFSRDAATLAGLRASLRKRLRESPLMDEKRFTRDLEHAYRLMWREWCRR